jgi:type II secretory pathway pseudopilin PulG
MRVKSQESRANAARRKAEGGRRKEKTFRPRPLSSFPLPPSAFPLRSGITLIELLVVIILLTTLVAAAIPLLSPSNDDRRLREASRGVNAFITGAQIKAVELRRPYGVALKKLGQDTKKAEDNAACLELYYVEQPPAYMGFDENSAVRIAFNSAADTGLSMQFVRRGFALPSSTDGLPEGLDSDLPPNMIRLGDVVEVAGNRYELTDTDTDANGFYRADSGDPDGELWIRPINDTGQMIKPVYDNFGIRLTDPTPNATRPAPYWTETASYKILRQPMPTSALPYQLPEGTAIDLRASGVGDDDYFYVPNKHDNPSGVIIMFAPEGSVSRVYFDRQPLDLAFDDPVANNLFLLVGRRDIIPAPPVGSDKTLDSAAITSLVTDQQRQAAREPINWLRGESRWIVIGAQSGRVVTTENAFVPLFDTTSYGANLDLARNEQIRQAREFAREMTQMGGR